MHPASSVREQDLFSRTRWSRRMFRLFLAASGCPPVIITFHSQDAADVDAAWAACRQFVLDSVRPTAIAQISFNRLCMGVHQHILLAAAERLPASSCPSACHFPQRTPRLLSGYTGWWLTTASQSLCLDHRPSRCHPLELWQGGHRLVLSSDVKEADSANSE